MREDMAVLLAARLVAGPLKWIEDRRENLLGAGQARHEHGRVRMAFDEEWHLPPPSSTTQDVGAYPNAGGAGQAAAAVGLMFPGPYRILAGNFTTKPVFEHAGRTAYRAVAFESVARGSCWTGRRAQRAWTLSSCAGATSSAATSCPTPTCFGCSTRTSRPLRRSSRRSASRLRGVPGPSRPPPGPRAATSASAPAPSSPPPRALASTAPRAPPSASSLGHGQRLRAGGRPGTASDHRRPASTADALGVSIDQVNTIQGDTAVTPFGAGTGAGRASGPMTAGAVARRRTLREKLVAIAAHRLEAAEDDIELAEGGPVRAMPAVA